MTVHRWDCDKLTRRLRRTVGEPGARKCRELGSGTSAHPKNQSNKLDTDSSAAVRLIASPISGAIDSSRILPASETAFVGRIESVITSSLRFDLATRAAAPPESTPWVM